MIAHLSLKNTRRAETVAGNLCRKLCWVAGTLSIWTLTAAAQTSGSVTLGWDPSTSSGIAGYRLYEGTASQSYTTSMNVGNVTSATAQGLAAGATYYFAVTALDTNGLESPFSGEIAYTAPASTPTQTPPPPTTGGLDFAAGSGTLSGPFTVNNGIVSQAVTTGVTNGGRAVYSFSISTPGDYLVSANIYAPNTSANSLYVNIDSMPTDPGMIWDVPVSAGFTKQAVAWRGNGTAGRDQFVPKVFNLTAGTHKLIVCGRAANTQFSAFTITPLTVLPAPWLALDIGKPGVTGSASMTNNLDTVGGAGAIGGAADRFRFLYQPMSGSGEIRAQITSFQNPAGGARAGVMIRETLTAGSKYAFIGVTSNSTYRLQTRTNTSGYTAGTSYGAASMPNAWVRLVRTNGTLFGYTSADGVTWTKTGSKTIGMATNVYVGLAVASGSMSTLSTSTFTNVVVVP